MAWVLVLLRIAHIGCFECWKRIAEQESRAADLELQTTTLLRLLDRILWSGCKPYYDYDVVVCASSSTDVMIASRYSYDIMSPRIGCATCLLLRRSRCSEERRRVHEESSVQILIPLYNYNTAPRPSNPTAAFLASPRRLLHINRQLIVYATNILFCSS